ncbi:cell wall hydrolase [Elioraea sp.]|uniref:cell wall hydrolase n=1 Tax=Elioraea sp. TaxID=2185103 RepID=UPI0025BBC2DC|nr:cell wall hydrolase [Elioraea sp.]
MRAHTRLLAVPQEEAARARHEAGVAALARALASTGAGERVRAIEALAAMVVNRLAAARARRAPTSWGMGLAAAVAAPGLFPEGAVPHDAVLIATCRRIAARAASGALPDPTGGAIAWHRSGTERPADAPAGEAVRIGGFVFLRAREEPAAEPQGWTAAEPQSARAAESG